MSRVDDLIAELCPDGVEYKTLGDLAVTLPGLTGKTKTDFTGGNARFASYRNIFANPSLNLAANDFVKVKEDEHQNFVQLGDILITGSSESIDEAGMSSVVTSNPAEPIYVNSFCFIVRLNQHNILNPNFAKHLFRSETIRKQIRGTASGVTRFNISKPRFMKICVPIPPLEVQREIVQILDKFTKLEAELEAELEARHKQYEYYRNQLLTFTENEARWIPMHEICTKINSGGTPQSDRPDFYGGNIPWLRTQEVDYTGITNTQITITDSGLLNSSAKWIPAHCVIVAMYGATAAKVAVNEIPLTTNQACCNLHIDPLQANYRYVFHWIANQYKNLKSLGEGSQSKLNAKKIKNYPIPVPPLEEQHRIVEILDKFDALVNNLTIGLPAEINARHKQYEYYRNKLLTFKQQTT